MEISKKRKNAHYRCAKIVLKDGSEYHETLETLYRRAMESDKIEQPIKMNVGSTGDVFVAMGTNNRGESLFNSATCACGWLSIYTEDRRVPTVTVDDNGVRSSQCMPTDADGNPNNWEEDSLIFAFKDNHVALFISLRGRVDRLEDMLNRLFIDKLALLPEGSQLYFESPLNASIEDKIRTCNIREIELNAAASASAHASQQIMETDWFRGTSMGLMHSVVGVIKERISSTGSNRFTAGLGLDEGGVPPLGLKMKFRAYHANIGEAQNTMRLLAAGTDGIDGLKVRFYMEDNTKIEGDQLTIKERLEVEYTDGNIDKISAMRALSHWLTSMRREGIIGL